ncbi:DUF928 domain-containing protein [Spirulina sp.]|uniref:DUF928 domain-containing protein n=1 Tax=Spirulina sp. TaxID=1157 RepID=UPI003F6F6F04
MTVQPITHLTHRSRSLHGLLILLLAGLLSSLPLAGQALTKQDLDPGNHGSPVGRDDGGGRGPVDSKLIALTPLSGRAETLTAHPIFWAHVPANAGWVMLRLQDVASQAQIAPIVAFPVGDGPGVMGFRWPESLPPLEVDRVYQWTLVYCCSEELVRSQLQVTGEVVRRSDQGLNSDELWDNPMAWFIKNGFWLDAIAIAAIAQSDNSRKASALWQEALTHPDIALDEVIDAPISRCCSVDGR